MHQGLVMLGSSNIALQGDYLLEAICYQKRNGEVSLQVLEHVDKKVFCHMVNTQIFSCCFLLDCKILQVIGHGM